MKTLILVLFAKTIFTSKMVSVSPSPKTLFKIVKFISRLRSVFLVRLVIISAIIMAADALPMKIY